MKLQKLLYCSYGWWQQLQGGRESFVSEEPQAWQYGPVFESLYHVLKGWGHKPIKKPQYFHPLAKAPSIEEEDREVRDLLKSVWQRYEEYTAFQMSMMTHSEGTPWNRIADKFGGGKRIPSGMVIPRAYIKEEFDRIAEQNPLQSFEQEASLEVADA